MTASGEVYGGFFPVTGSRVFLFSPGTGGVGGASTSLISSSSPGALLDATAGSITNGARYVTTDSRGSFSFTSTCTPGAQVYLYASGGVATTGGSNNPQIGLMSVVGTCPATSTIDAFPYIRITENTTVAAGYALAGFAVDPGHISTSGSSLALTGLSNAAATANSLFNVAVPVNSLAASTGFGTTTTAPGSTGTLPQTLLNTLSNILVACVNSGNSASATTTGCNNLRKYATSDGLVASGPVAPATGSFSATAPSDTSTAIINMAHHPFASVSTLFALQGTGAAAPYKPALSSAPSSFMVEILYTGGGLSDHASDSLPHQVAIDGVGNVWMVNYTNSNVGKFSPLGVPLSGTTGFTSTGANCPLTGTFNGSTSYPASIAIDVSGNAWIGYTNNLAAVCELSPSGVYIFGTTTGSSPAQAQPYAGVADIAFDASGSAWVVDDFHNTLLQFNGTTHALTATKTGNGLNFPYGIAIDAPSTFSGHTGYIWVADADQPYDSVFNSAGTAVGTVTAGTAEYATGIAIDSNGFVWSLSYGSAGFLSKTSPSGATGTSYSFPSLDNEISIAMDGASNVWICNYDQGSYNVIAEVSNSGALLTPAAGFIPINGGTGTQNYANAIAIDGSGNVWYPMSLEFTLRELVGAAVPVATPIAYGTVNNKLGARP